MILFKQIGGAEKINREQKGQSALSPPHALDDNRKAQLKKQSQELSIDDHHQNTFSLKRDRIDDDWVTNIANKCELTEQVFSC